MKKINLNTASFEKLIVNDRLYIDKTEYAWHLLNSGDSEFFLSRPRRFGKSLFVSTLKAIFQGKRELFKGLAIDRKDYDWQTYPIIHLDFGACNIKTADRLEAYLNHLLAKEAESLGLKLREEGASVRFENLIADAAGISNVGQVVILADEYDKPILGNIDNPDVSNILTVLKGFYSVIKTYEESIRFAFITGVSKFAHVSLFSDLNNLTDITLSPDYAEMLGFSEAEIRDYFADRIPLAAEANGVSVDELMQTLLKWYDGYRFSDADTHVCNPVSLSTFFSKDYKLSNYWDATGTPEFLVKLSRERAYDYEAALEDWYDDSIFAAYELDQLDITGLLWQTGYLTIKETRKGRRGIQYRLDFPDQEVAETFTRRLLEYYGNVAKGAGTPLVDSFADAIEAGDLKKFLTLFQSFLAGIDYRIHLPYEKYYQTIFFCVFKLLGLTIDAESCTNEGRIDAYIQTAKNVYLFEFKLDKSAQTAVTQIVSNHYYEKFLSCGLPITLVGVNFDSEKGRIDDWKTMTL